MITLKVFNSNKKNTYNHTDSISTIRYTIFKNRATKIPALKVTLVDIINVFSHV